MSDPRQFTIINVRSVFLRIGQLEMSVREDGSLLIVTGGQRLELDRVSSEVLAGMFEMVSRR